MESRQARKEVLSDKIWEMLTGLAQGWLSEQEKITLAGYREELARILEQERLEREAEKQEKSREMKQRRGRGKYGERRLAKVVGGTVVGRSKSIITGTGKAIKIDCQKPPDVVTDLFSFESKWLKEVPANIRKVMTQAVGNAPPNLIPVGVIGDRQQRTVYYILMEKDWLDLHGKGD